MKTLKRPKPAFRPLPSLDGTGAHEPKPFVSLSEMEREIIAESRALAREMRQAGLTGAPPPDHALYAKWLALREKIEASR